MTEQEVFEWLIAHLTISVERSGNRVNTTVGVTNPSTGYIHWCATDYFDLPEGSS